MRTYLSTFRQFAPYLALAALSIFGLVDTPIVIAIMVVLMTTTRGRSCLKASQA